MVFEIREACLADAELIADISRQTFYDTFAEHNTKADMDMFLNEQFTKEALMAEVGKPENIFLLAYDEDNVAGYVRLIDNSTHDELPYVSTLEIARIYVLTPYIGKGAGHALMQACIHKAERMHKQILWLGVWEHNQRAIDFYTKYGFEKFSDHSFTLGNDIQNDWLMKYKVKNQK
ncbi:GNAT family N-acetyltransferase [Chitinophagaceae bacterium LWZ2-11]